MATKPASSKKWAIQQSRAVLAFENFLQKIILVNRLDDKSQKFS